MRTMQIALSGAKTLSTLCRSTHDQTALPRPAPRVNGKVRFAHPKFALPYLGSIMM